MPKALGKVSSRLLRAYYLGPDHPMKLRLWYGFLRALGYPRLTVPYHEKGWITLDIRDFLQRIIFAQGCYEPEVWTALSESLTKDEIFWDVGAHVGTFSVQALMNERISQVHCFEPNPTTAEFLRLNLSLNEGNYQVHEIGLGSKKSKLPLYQGPPTNTGLATFQTTSTWKTTTVTCLAVDEVIARGLAPAPTLMKIDVEGWEEEVLRGAHELLNNSPPKAIVLEAPYSPTEKIQNPHLEGLLALYGYQLSWIPRYSSPVQARENFLAVHS